MNDISTDLVHETRPPNKHERLLQEKFSESVATQSEQMDKLAQQLITLELAIPGIYATVLKLTQGETGTLPVNNWLYATFLLWTLALFLTLWSLTPQRWHVDTKLMSKSKGDMSDVLGIEDFFHKSAQYKRQRLILASLLFWMGIVCAVMVVF